MKDWANASTLLSNGLSDFLASALPEIGGEDWWQVYVIEQLTPGQARSVGELKSGDIRALDLAALIRVAERSWSEFVFQRSMSRDARALLGELKVARNRYAHAPVNGVPIDDQLRDVDTVLRFMQAIGSSEDKITELSALRKKLLLQLMKSSEESTSSNESPANNDEQNHSDDHNHAENKVSSGESISLTPTLEDLGPKGGGWIIDSSAHSSEIRQAVSKKTYVGIDFGTSTSVVSVFLNNSKNKSTAKTLSIEQPAEYGAKISHHLVNTVLAWHQDELLFGRDAYRMRQELFEGRNVFSSFKMKLGINIGPTYPETALPRGKSKIAIEDANDATREFFRLLSKGIKKAVAEADWPEELCFAVTVPASFEANQRRDLLNNMKDAGLPVSGSCLIDEPNAAFLSFLHEAGRDQNEKDLIERLKIGPTNILVYDFGAGTCDVSILEVSIDDGRISSRNRAISRFTALGGDDFDRAIAKNVLLPQLLKNDLGFDPELRDIEERLIPRLQPTAERLKLAAVDWLTDRGVTTLSQLRGVDCQPFEDLAIPTFSVRGREQSLRRPTLTLLELAEAMKPFVERYDPDVSTAHVFAPVADALDKSGLDPSDLEAVLFIGGSAANPIVRNAVMSHLPKSVRAIVPSDLRTHVSLGAALHSLGYHAFDFNLIKPITSEPIFVITRGGKLETIVPAASDVPSQRDFITRLQVLRSGQHTVILPICVSNENKLLGLLKIESNDENGFSAGEEVLITARITQEKLLDIEAEVAGLSVKASLLNPLANRDLTPAETRMLEAKQRFNDELLSNGVRISKEVVISYAEAALSAEAFEQAADMFVAAERIDPSENHAINICYAYSKAGREERSHEWAKRAHERAPSALTAYNLACGESGEKKETLLREALMLDKNYPNALLSLGQILLNRNNDEAKQLIKRSINVWLIDLDNHHITKGGCRNLITAASLVSQNNVIERAQARLDTFKESALFDEDSLASSSVQPALLAR